MSRRVVLLNVDEAVLAELDYATLTALLEHAAETGQHAAAAAIRRALAERGEL